MKPITLSFIDSFKEQLHVMSNATEVDVTKIFGGDPNLIVDNIYSFDMPLYKKMVFRYRNANNSIIQLCREVDPGNQQRVLNYFNLSYFDLSFKDLLEFFGYIHNMMGSYHVENLLEGAVLDSHAMKELLNLKKYNDIKFYFSLDDHIKEKLIEIYNKEHYISNNI